jgi:hypothetical protein
MDTVEAVYPSFAAAAQAQAIGDEKWIPSFVPRSATDIREIHNLDTNEVWLAFRFESQDREWLDRPCVTSGDRPMILPRRRPADWWPEVLVRSGNGTRYFESYRFYRCGTKGIVAIDGTGATAYYWALD